MASKNEEIDENILRHSAPPPPAPSVPRPSVMGGAGATLQPPAPPRATVAPPVPPRSTNIPAPPGPAALPRPTTVGAVLPKPKKIMMGMPAVGAQPPSPSSAPANISIEWDDDEGPTNIYSTSNSAGMAAAMRAKGNTVTPAQKPEPAPAPTPQRQSAPMPSLASQQSRPIGSGMINDDAIFSVQPKKNNNIIIKNKNIVISAAAGILLAIALIVAMKMFLIDSTGVAELTIEPGDDLSVTLDGTEPVPQNVSPLTVEDLKEGTHTFIIAREGYASKEVTLAIKAGETRKTTIKLQSEGASSDGGDLGFLLETNPPGATVEVDGKIIDEKTPLTVSGISAGNHVVKISKDRFREERFEVTVTEGENAKLPVKQLTLARASVTFNTDPQGTQVTLIEDSKRIDIGKTPSTYELETDKTYQVEYACADEKVTNDLGDKELPKGQENVELAKVTCAPAVEEEAPAVVAKVEKPKSSVNKPRPPRGGNNNKPKTPAPAPSGADGFLSVQTRPWSQVYINNQFVKSTPVLRKKLKPGRYNIMVVNEGFGIKKQFFVTVKSGKTTTFVRQLI